jgi:hypothetical protein
VNLAYSLCSVRAATSGLTAEERSLICVLVEVASLGVVSRRDDDALGVGRPLAESGSRFGRVA